MPLEFAATQDAVPEAQRAGAIEVKDGRWAYEKPSALPSDLGATGQAAIDAMKQAVKDAKKEAADAKKRADDLETAQQARDKNIPAEALAAMKAAEEAARAPIIKRAEEAEARLQRLEMVRQVREAAALPDVGMMTERLDDDMMDVLLKQLAPTDAGGVAVKDRAGNVTTVALKDHLVSLKATKPFLFRGTGSSGGDSLPSNGDGHGSAYDPRAAGLAAAKAQTAGMNENLMAFK